MTKVSDSEFISDSSDNCLKVTQVVIALCSSLSLTEHDSGSDDDEEFSDPSVIHPLASRP